MSKVKILVVEDEFIVAEEILETLKKQDFDVVGKASNADKALEIARKTTPDIALLDINIDGDLDGIQLAEKLRAELNIAIIFLTAFDEKHYLDRASAVSPSAYIVKPFEARNLIVAITMAFKKLESNTEEEVENKDAYFVQDRIFIKEGTRFNKLMVESITFAEAVGSYTDIYTKEKKLTLTINLKQFSQKLKHPKFIRVHRSYMVNIDAVDAFEGNTIHIGDHHIPISASYKEDFLRSIRTI